jgi:hypothetical protein
MPKPEYCLFCDEDHRLVAPCQVRRLQQRAAGAEKAARDRQDALWIAPRWRLAICGLVMLLFASFAAASVQVCVWNGEQGSWRVVAQNQAEGWQQVACVTPCPGSWESCVGVPADGLGRLALLVDGAGVALRWNRDPGRTAAALLFYGGGGNVWPDTVPRDLAGDSTDWYDLQVRGWRIVAVRWRATGIFYDFDAGRFIRPSAAGWDIRDADQRVVQLVDWFGQTMSPAVPLALLGSSAGGDAAMAPLWAPAAVRDRIRLVENVSGMPTADLTSACSGFTPAGTLVNADTGARGSSGWGNPPCFGGASCSAENFTAALWRSSECLDDDVSAAREDRNGVLRFLDFAPGLMNWTGKIRFYTATGSANNDNLTGITWSLGQIMEHPAWASAQEVWSRAVNEPHGGPLRNPQNVGFSVLHADMVAVLGTPSPTPTATPTPTPPPTCLCPCPCQ